MAGKKKTAGFERKLRAYSAAAAGLLVLAPAADAAIRYSGPMSITVDSGNPLGFVDINNDGTNDFGVKYFTNTTTTTTTTTYFLKGHLILGYNYSNQAILTGSSPFVDNLPSQYLIKSSLSSPRLWKYAGIMDIYSSYEGSVYGAGQFLGTHGCIGVRFLTPGGMRYGWIGYGAAADAGQGTITGWAYEDTGAPISACDTGLITTVPTLNQWGMMALIALLAGGAVTALRRRERFSSEG